MIFVDDMLTEEQTEKLNKEDEIINYWQHFIHSFGAWSQVNHLTHMSSSDPKVEAYVTHAKTYKAGKNGLFQCENLRDYPVANDLMKSFNSYLSVVPNGPYPPFNSRESLLYRSNKDFCSYHNGDGVQLNYYSAMLSCYRGTLNSVFRVIRNVKVGLDNGEELVIVNKPRQAMIIGGIGFHQYYTHAKFFPWKFKPFDWFKTDVFRTLDPFRIDKNNPYHSIRGIRIKWDKSNNSTSYIWSNEYYIGKVRKNSTDSFIVSLNQDLIRKQSNSEYWEIGDEFQNMNILRWLHLHPTTHSGVAANRIVYSIVINYSSTSNYQNSVQVSDDFATIRYHIRCRKCNQNSKFALNCLQLKNSMEEKNCIRVWIKSHPNFNGNSNIKYFCHAVVTGFECINNNHFWTLKEIKI